MDEKKLGQVESLEDQQLEDVSGGSFRLSREQTDADEARVLSDDEELDGKIPHLPVVRPPRSR